MNNTNNIVTVEVMFKRLPLGVVSTPTFQQHFGRIKEVRELKAIPYLTYAFSTNHTHAAQLKRNIFGDYISRITFNGVEHPLP